MVRKHSEQSRAKTGGAVEGNPCRFRCSADTDDVACYEMPMLAQSSIFISSP